MQEIQSGDIASFIVIPHDPKNMERISNYLLFGHHTDAVFEFWKESGSVSKEVQPPSEPDISEAALSEQEAVYDQTQTATEAAAVEEKTRAVRDYKVNNIDRSNDVLQGFVASKRKLRGSDPGDLKGRSFRTGSWTRNPEDAGEPVSGAAKEVKRHLPYSNDDLKKNLGIDPVLSQSTQEAPTVESQADAGFEDDDSGVFDAMAFSQESSVPEPQSGKENIEADSGRKMTDLESGRKPLSFAADDLKQELPVPVLPADSDTGLNLNRLAQEIESSRADSGFFARTKPVAAGSSGAQPESELAAEPEPESELAAESGLAAEPEPESELAAEPEFAAESESTAAPEYRAEPARESSSGLVPETESGSDRQLASESCGLPLREEQKEAAQDGGDENLQTVVPAQESVPEIENEPAQQLVDTGSSAELPSSPESVSDKPPLVRPFHQSKTFLIAAGVCVFFFAVGVSSFFAVAYLQSATLKETAGPAVSDSDSQLADPIEANDLGSMPVNASDSATNLKSSDPAAPAQSDLQSPASISGTQAQNSDGAATVPAQNFNTITALAPAPGPLPVTPGTLPGQMPPQAAPVTARGNAGAGSASGPAQQSTATGSQTAMAPLKGPLSATAVSTKLKKKISWKDSDLTGYWSLDYKTPTDSIARGRVEIIQDKNRFRGYGEDEIGPYQIEGVVSGKKVSFTKSYVRNKQLVGIPIPYTGKISTGKNGLPRIDGNWQVSRREGYNTLAHMVTYSYKFRGLLLERPPDPQDDPPPPSSSEQLQYQNSSAGQAPPSPTQAPPAPAAPALSGAASPVPPTAAARGDKGQGAAPDPFQF